MRAPRWATPADKLYEAALAQAAWADNAGFTSIRILEHHGSGDGYCTSPIVLASAMAAMTSRIRIRLRALILPLHDPVRVAEDCAMVDVISRGRLELVVGAGYVPSEFAMFGVELADRVGLLEQSVSVLRKAWKSEPFEHEGREILVGLPPHRLGGPPISLAGSSKGAARRAARIADGFEPTHWRLFAEYATECTRLDVQPGPPPRRRPPGQFLLVSEDPAIAWRELGPNLLHEMNSYGAWLGGSETTPLYHNVSDIDELRDSGAYSIVTPAECLALCRTIGAEGELEFHPLVGGANPKFGWDSLRLFERDVLPILVEEGLYQPPTSIQ